MTIDTPSLATLPESVRDSLARVFRAMASAIERGDEEALCRLAESFEHAASTGPADHPHVPSPHQGAAVAPGPPCPAHRGNCCCF